MSSMSRLLGVVILSGFIVGCGGGTIGTGFPKFQDPHEEPKKSSGSFWSMLTRASDRCAFPDQQIRVVPDGAMVEKSNDRANDCRVELTHASRVVTLYVFARRKLAPTASVEVERETCGGDLLSDGSHVILPYGHDPRMGVVEIRGLEWKNIRNVRLKFGDGSNVTLARSGEDRCGASGGSTDAK